MYFLLLTFRFSRRRTKRTGRSFVRRMVDRWGLGNPIFMFVTRNFVSLYKIYKNKHEISRNFVLFSPQFIFVVYNIFNKNFRYFAKFRLDTLLRTLPLMTTLRARWDQRPYCKWSIESPVRSSDHWTASLINITRKKEFSTGY